MTAREATHISHGVSRLVRSAGSPARCAPVATPGPLRPSNFWATRHSSLFAVPHQSSALHSGPQWRPAPLRSFRWTPARERPGTAPLHTLSRQIAATPASLSRPSNRISLALALRRYKSDDKSSRTPSASNTPPTKTPNPTGAERQPDEGYQFLTRLPDLSQRFHRPTKEELLAAATGFWSRLRVRFKWFSIRSARPFNVDEISAFATWILAGHLVWILLGTTTFFSLLILAVNTVFAQETLAGWVGNYLTQSSGIKVVFESAIVPKWRDGVITFKNVFISRRPGQHKANVSKGSSKGAVAAAAARIMAERELDNHDEEEEDTNYTQYDVSMETINVTLSFAKWVNGHGLLKDVEIKGVRGVVDRTAVHSDPQIDPRSYKHKHDTGDFELESFKMEDLLVSVYQPGGFRPFSVSVFSADLPQLRKQWLFYDFLSANNVSGSFDGSPFFIHPRQTHNLTGALLEQPNERAEIGTWKKQSRIRVDGLSIDHLNKGVEGPFGWITEGNVDIAADIMFPVDDDESLARIVSEFYDKVEASVTSNRYVQQAGRAITEDFGRDHEKQAVDSAAEKDKLLILDFRIHLNDVFATIPLFQDVMSSTNATLMRPIVAYINSNRSFIPINCRVIKPVTDFDGSWTIYDSLLMSEVGNEVYDAFARDVLDEQKRRGRVKKVVVWSLGLAVKALLLGLAGNVA